MFVLLVRSYHNHYHHLGKVVGEEWETDQR